MWGHLRGLFFVDFSKLHHSSAVLKVIYFLTGFGHQAVMVFFVLSGFLISNSIIKKLIAGAWSSRSYAIDRISRLYVVLIPGLLLGLLWDESGRLLFASSGLYSQPLAAFGTIIAQQQISLKNFVGNLLFVQTILCQTFGSNGPLWSLANEFWYYVLFPSILITGIAWRRSLFRVAIIGTALVVGVAVFVGSSILLGFLIWLAGCGLVLACRKFRLKRRTTLAPYFLVFSSGLCICLFASRTGRFGILGGDLLVGLAFSFFLFGVLQMDYLPRNPNYARIAHFLSGFSYSLYLLHFPFLLFLRGCIAPTTRWQPDLEHLVYGSLIGILVLGYSWFVAFFTENRTHVVRKWMRKWFGRRELGSIRS
jgi:peptidoglycan/LPS O-acetylase OafA/YrhL